MKKTVVLGLLAGMLLFSTGNALAVVGAEEPPEGMMGITAIMDSVDPDQPVESGELIPEELAEELMRITAVGENQLPLEIDGEITITKAAPVVESAPDNEDAAEKKPNYLNYGLLGFLAAGAATIVAKKVKK